MAGSPKRLRFRLAYRLPNRLTEVVEPRGVEPLTFALRTSVPLLVAAGLERP